MRTHNVDGYKFQEKYENNRIQKSKQRDVQEKNEIKKKNKNARARANKQFMVYTHFRLSLNLSMMLKS